MKRSLYTLIAASFLSVSVFADTIVLQDASTITAYNVEEAGRWVIYTLEENENAPIQRIAIDKVFAIKTADGNLRNVGETSLSKEETYEQTNNNGPHYLSAMPAPDNADHIHSYNTPTLSLKKPKGEKDKEKYCSDFLSVWGITSNSILSDENISIDFVMTMAEGKRKALIPQYKTRITNKTDKPLYIDLANSFKFRPDGSATPYYTNAVYTEGNSGSKGGSLNLGAVAGAVGLGGAVGTLATGINVGGSNTKSATVTTAEERILMIPPYASSYLPSVKYSDGHEICTHEEILYYRTMPVDGSLAFSSNLMEVDKDYRHAVEQGGLDMSITRNELKAPQGWIRNFDEDNTIKSIRRMVTYSLSPAFDTYTSLNYTLFIRGIMGSNPQWNVPRDYDQHYLTTDDVNHLLVGVGKVKK